MRCHRLVVYAICTLFVTAARPALASDWPQWLGPNRNGISTETGLMKKWPDGGPKLKWKATGLGDNFSFSAPAIARGRVYLLAGFKEGKEEQLIALDEKDGSKVWAVKIGKSGPVDQANGNYPGPRGTPTVDGNRIFTLCSDGEIVCLDQAKGDIIWSKNLVKDFSGNAPKWAYSESPLVDGDLVIVSPGGSTASVVALHKKDGSLAWKASVPGNPKAAYGSPIRIDVGGLAQYVSVLSKGLVGVSATDGKLLWKFEGVANSQGINIPTPLYHDSHIFGVSGYGKGGGVARLTVDQDKVTATPGWFNSDLAAVQQIGGFVRVGEHLYGTASAAKNKVELVCVEFKTGKVVWHDAAVGKGELCVADGMLYVRGEKDGTVILAEATPAGYKEAGRLKQPDRSKREAWPYPVVSNGCLYLRDLGVLLCYDVSERK
jgi:outer membrane protein assembly factor BamB